MDITTYTAYFTRAGRVMRVGEDLDGELKIDGKPVTVSYDEDGKCIGYSFGDFGGTSKFDIIRKCPPVTTGEYTTEDGSVAVLNSHEHGIFLGYVVVGGIKYNASWDATGATKSIEVYMTSRDYYDFNLVFNDSDNEVLPEKKSKSKKTADAIPCEAVSPEVDNPKFVNCVVCGTRFNYTNNPASCELDTGRWVCSSECYEEETSTVRVHEKAMDFLIEVMEYRKPDNVKWVRKTLFSAVAAVMVSSGFKEP